MDYIIFLVTLIAIFSVTIFAAAKLIKIDQVDFGKALALALVVGMLNSAVLRLVPFSFALNTMIVLILSVPACWYIFRTSWSKAAAVAGILAGTEFLIALMIVFMQLGSAMTLADLGEFMFTNPTEQNESDGDSSPCTKNCIETHMDDSESSLIEAVCACDVSSVQLALEGGADPNMKTASGESLLDMARFRVDCDLDQCLDCAEVVGLLCDFGADECTEIDAYAEVSCKNLPQLNLQFFESVMEGDHTSAKAALLLGANVNVQVADFNEFTALHGAISNSDNTMVELLLSFGADMNLPAADFEGSPGATPLQMSVHNCDELNCDLLLQHAQDQSIPISYYHTLSAIASGAACDSLVELLNNYEF